MLGTSPSTGRPADRRRAETRREIIDAAWALCRTRGLAQLSLRELAGRVGIKAPSLYSYFSSKYAIYDAMYADGQRAFAALLSRFPVEAMTREDFRAGNHAFFEFGVSDPTRYQLLFQRTLPGFVPSAESYALAITNLEWLQRRLTGAGVKDPRHLDLWTAMMSGLVDQQLANDPGGDRWHQLLDEAVDLYCDHVGIPAAATKEF
jgi:AcrR family transcriptional regulator